MVKYRCPEPNRDATSVPGCLTSYVIHAAGPVKGTCQGGLSWSSSWYDGVCMHYMTCPLALGMLSMLPSQKRLKLVLAGRRQILRH